MALCMLLSLFPAFAFAQDVTPSPSSLSWASAQIGQVSGAKSFSLTNNQAGPLTISSISVPSGSDFIQGASTCPLSPSTLAAAASCTVSIQFRPLASGTRTNAVTILDDAPSLSQSVPLSGLGTVGPILFSPTSLPFTNVAVGATSAPQSATLTNTLSNAITLTSIKVGARFAQTNDCPVSPSTLAPGGTCTFSVTYSPIAAGSSSTGVWVAFDTGTTTSLLQLYLWGSTQVNYVTLTPASANFGSVLVGASSASQSLTLTNNYTQAVTLSSIATSLTDYAVSSNCPVSPSTLASNATCAITLTFTPTATGTRSDTLTVSHNAPGSAATAALTGTGTATVSGVSFSPTSLAWGNVQIGQAASAKTVTLTNDTSAALTIASIGVGSDYAVTSTTCPLSPSTVAVGASCTISVAFHPLAQGIRSDMITVTDNDASSPQQVALSGTGVIGPVLFSPTSLTFPSTAVGSTSPNQTAILTNQQATSLTISGITTTGNFSQTNDCPATLPGNGTCTVTVNFAPPSSGTKTGGVNVNYGSGTQSLFLSGTATGGTTGSVTVSPKSYAFPNQAVGTTSAPVTITLTNGQTTGMAISSIQINAPFSQTNNCGTSLAAGGSCAITVTYAPTATGFTNTNLVITDDAAGSPQSAAISGNAVLAVSTVPVVGGLYFYNQIVLTPSTPLPVKFTNNQSVPLTISSLGSTGDYPFTTDCVGSNGSGTLAANASCTVSISFNPQALGTRAAALTVTESAMGSPLSIPLTGTGISGDPGLTVIVGPNAPCSLASQTTQFNAIVTGTANTAVMWYVDNILNGSSTAGTITPDGLYTAPGTYGTHIVRAVSQAPTKVAGSTVINVSSSPNFAIYPYTASIPPSGQQTFQPQICFVPDSGAVTWTVDYIAGGNSTVGTVTNSGVYTAPAVAGKHTVRVTDTAVNKTSGAVVTVFSNISADFGSRAITTYPIPADMLGAGRGEAMQSVADRTLITQAGVTVSRLYAQVPLVYATQTPNWTRIDPLIASIQAAGQKVLLQISLTPPWLQPSPNPCGAGNNIVAPADVTKWGQMAASYVTHLNAAFPGFVQDYEIWNEPNAAGLCANDHLKSYMAIYAAAAPLMKAAANGATIHIGGPVLSGYTSLWLNAILNDPTTAPYVDFVSYHQYLFGTSGVHVQWDSYNGNISLYQQTQDPSNGAVGVYNKVYQQIKLGKQPLGAATPIYVTEFNTNWAFLKDCCRNDPTYAPIWNALYVSDMLNSVYNGLPAVPSKLIYFASSAYPWFCIVGVPDQNSDCLYSAQATPQPYPQYYAFQLIASNNYLGLMSGGYMAKSVTPLSGGGGLAATAFYTATQDSIVITNPTATAYSQIPVSLQNVGFATPQATLYQIVNGAMINSSSLSLTQQGSGYTATIDVPAYSVQGISVKSQ